MGKWHYKLDEYPLESEKRFQRRKKKVTEFITLLRHKTNGTFLERRNDGHLYLKFWFVADNEARNITNSLRRKLPRGFYVTKKPSKNRKGLVRKGYSDVYVSSREK